MLRQSLLWQEQLVQHIRHVVPGAELGCNAFPGGVLAEGRAAGNCFALLRGVVPQQDKGMTK